MRIRLGFKCSAETAKRGWGCDLDFTSVLDSDAGCDCFNPSGTKKPLSPDETSCQWCERHMGQQKKDMPAQRTSGGPSGKEEGGIGGRRYKGMRWVVGHRKPGKRAGGRGSQGRGGGRKTEL